MTTSGHVTKMAVTSFDLKKISCCTQTALSSLEPQLLPIEVLHCRNRDFPPFLLMSPWPWPDDLHIQT